MNPRWRKSSFSGNGGNCVEVGDWRKSSYSDNGGNCIEVGEAWRGVLVRDTQDPHGPVLVFTTGVWRRFAGQVRTGA
jgi:Domain of unknown function (DUF397)